MTHQLDEEIKKENQAALCESAKSILRRAEKGISERNKFIRARELQKAEIESIRAETYKAYDMGDAEKLSELNGRLNIVLSTSSTATMRKASARVVDLQQYDPFEP